MLIRLWFSQWLILIKFSADDKGDIKEIKVDMMRRKKESPNQGIVVDYREKNVS